LSFDAGVAGNDDDDERVEASFLHKANSRGEGRPVEVLEGISALLEKSNGEYAHQSEFWHEQKYFAMLEMYSRNVFRSNYGNYKKHATN
jgi:hypothetical protein